MAPPYSANTTADELTADFANEIRGKVILTTGVSPGGLGAAFAESIANAQPSLLILAGRNSQKVQQTADAIAAAQPNIKTKILKLDLASLAGARSAAEEVNSWDDVPIIDVLVNNAGIMATEYATSPDGFENQLATNHLGPFLFTNLIMDKILNSKTPRIVNVTSDGHRLNPIRFDDPNFDDGKTYNKWSAYGQSKTANMLFCLSLAEKLGKRGLLAFSLHPGVIGTNLGNHLNGDFQSLRYLSMSVKYLHPIGLEDADRALGNGEGWRDFNFKSLQQGAATHVYASFEPSLVYHNGAYLLDSRIADPWKDTVKSWAVSSSDAERLWQLSEKFVGAKFEY